MFQAKAWTQIGMVPCTSGTIKTLKTRPKSTGGKSKVGNGKPNSNLTWGMIWAILRPQPRL